MFTAPELHALLVEHRDDPLQLLQHLDGYYQRPPGGPLVGYAGTYREGEVERNYVGEVYANFAKAEKYPLIMNRWSQVAREKLSEQGIEVDVFLGAPEGGKSLADKLALNTPGAYVYPDVRALHELSNKRIRKEFFWGRHEVEPGQRVAIAEDVANNFSTTNALIDLVVASGCIPVALICILNRSPEVDGIYHSTHGAVPVVSLVRRALPEYRQDHPHVAADVAAGNIVWKPKDEWEKLKAVMAALPS